MRYLFSCGLLGLMMVCRLHADWRDEVGFTRLVEIAAGEIPTSVTNGVAQIEAPDQGNYTPDTASSRFAGKNFTLESGASDESLHASLVAENFYGTASQLPGSFPVSLYNANDWLEDGFLRTGTRSLPRSEPRSIQNHSWIAGGGNSEEANRRLDYAIQEQGFMSIVGQNNGNSTVLPGVLGQGYHSLSVGLTNGNHSAGFTNIDGSGRIKPELVAPADVTSFATPMVAGASALLYEKISAAPYSVPTTRRPLLAKALLLATARKDVVPSWQNTNERPLDLRYGAGSLNTYHAYVAMRSGRAASSPDSFHGIRGWSDEVVNANSAKTWFFTIPEGAAAHSFCAAITWNRTVTTFNLGLLRTWSYSLADVNLRLYRTNQFTLAEEISSSLSTVDNVEMIYQSSLPPGNYALVVENLSLTNRPIGLAWHSLPSVKIEVSQAIAKEENGQQGIFRISRTGDTTLPLVVYLGTGGTAVSGLHFQPLPTSIVIPAGHTFATISVVPLPDRFAQGERTVTLSLLADFSYERANTTGTIRILDQPFDQWRFERFSPVERSDASIAGESADPDSDGIKNLIEYAIGYDPKVPNPSPFQPQINEGYLSLAVAKNSHAPDITWSAQVSGDLNEWHTAIIEENDLNHFRAKDSQSAEESDARFIRLKITRN